MRLALRSISREKGFTALAVLSMAAAIGLIAALASVADAILFRPLPVAKPDQIVRMFTASAEQPFGLVSYPDFEDFRAASRTLAGIVAQSQILIAIGGEKENAQIRLGLAVTADYFSVLGVAPALGRTFRPDEARDAVVVLANAFWRSNYGADPQIVGRTIQLGGTPFTVIGVAAKDFGLDRFSHEDFFVPMGVYAAGLLPATGRPLEDRGRRYLSVYGRLAGGATGRQASAEFAAIAARLAAEYPQTNRARRAVVLTEYEARTRTDRTMPALAELLAAVAVLILIIACANVAGLLLARAETRALPIAVRVALGASRTRLLGDSVIETCLLCVAGAALGLPMAWGTTRLLAHAATLPTDFRFAIAPSVDGRVACVTAVVMALMTVVCGAVPVFAAKHHDITALLKSSRVAGGKSIWRSILVTVEIALAAALLACGGLVLKGIASAGEVDLGYRTDHVRVITLDPAQIRYGEGQARVFYDQLLDRVRRLPGVKAAELAQSVPLGYTSAQRLITVEGERERQAVWMNIVTPGYFDLMHLRFLGGRRFDQRDTAISPPVLIVNQELARRCASCAIGGRIGINGRAFEVIGVVRTARYFRIGEAPRPYFYLPFAQNYASRMVLHVESPEDAARVLGAIHQIDSNQPVSEVRVLNDYLSQGAMFNARIAVDAMSVVGLCGLLLALAGLYGVISHGVTRRRREIGLRMALGARRPVVVMFILGHGFRIIGVGTAGGLGTAVAAARLLASLISGTHGLDWRVLTAAALIVAGASLAACLIPAWRASAMDPAAALRQE